MVKYCRGTAKMNWREAYKLSILALLGLSACSSERVWWGSGEGEEVVYVDQTTIVQEQTAAPVEVPCVQEQPARPVIVPPEEDDPMINYRRTAAEYRTYGERTPRDQYYTQGGAGGNMTAAIPPTIEEEVSDYETAVNSAFDQAIDEAYGTNGGMSTGDEAVEDWLAEEGDTLKGLLSEWCERSGWRLIWNSNRNYTLSAGAMFRGRFADVTSALIRTFARAQPAPMATFYKGNRVLVVETKEDENAYN